MDGVGRPREGEGRHREARLGGPGWRRDAQGGPGRARKAHGGAGSPREAQRSPGRPREAQGGHGVTLGGSGRHREKPREAQRAHGGTVRLHKSKVDDSFEDSTFLAPKLRKFTSIGLQRLQHTGFRVFTINSKSLSGDSLLVAALSCCAKGTNLSIHPLWSSGGDTVHLQRERCLPVGGVRLSRRGGNLGFRFF